MRENVRGEKKRKKKKKEKEREKREKGCPGSFIYQSAFNSQKEKLNILAEMLEISKSSCIYIWVKFLRAYRA